MWTCLLITWISFGAEGAGSDAFGKIKLDAPFSSIVETASDNSVVAIASGRKHNPLAAISPLTSVVLICREELDKLAVTRELVIGESPISAIAFSKSAKRLAVSDVGGAIHLWSTSDWSRNRTIRIRKSSVSDIEFLGDDSLASSGVDWATQRTKIIIWDLTTGKPTKEKNFNDSYDLITISTSPCGKFLATGDTNGITQVWDLASFREIATFQHDNSLVSVEFSPSGKYLACADQSGTILVICADSWRVHAKFAGHGECGICDVDFVNDNSLFSVGGEDDESEVFLWSLSRKNLARTYMAGASRVMSCAVWHDTQVLTISLAGRVTSFTVR
jgi:WD40 repeat protein